MQTIFSPVIFRFHFSFRVENNNNNTENCEFTHTLIIRRETMENQSNCSNNHKIIETELRHHGRQMGGRTHTAAATGELLQNSRL